MEIVNITVSVPADCVGDVMRFTADLYSPQKPRPITPLHKARPDRPRRNDALQRAYLGGTSDKWRPACDALASKAGEWVTLDELADELGVDRSAMRGILGAGERRCSGKPPYEKRWTDGKREYRMSTEVADAIEAIKTAKAA